MQAPAALQMPQPQNLFMPLLFNQKPKRSLQISAQLTALSLSQHLTTTAATQALHKVLHPAQMIESRLPATVKLPSSIHLMSRQRTGIPIQAMQSSAKAILTAALKVALLGRKQMLLHLQNQLKTGQGT